MLDREGEAAVVECGEKELMIGTAGRGEESGGGGWRGEGSNSGGFIERTACGGGGGGGGSSPRMPVAVYTGYRDE